MHRKALLITLMLLSAGLLGCGGLTGGSVPPGNPGPARLTGTVVDGQDPSVPIAKADVEIVTEDGQVLTTQTDTGGQFEVQVSKGKKYLVRVKPPTNLAAAFQERETEILVGEDEDEVRIVLPMLRSEMTVPMVMQVRIEPERVTLKVGERQTFQLKTTPEPPMPLRPVWSVHGSIGVINADGVFTATHAGRGRVRARVGDLRAEAQVVVLPATPGDEGE